VIDLADEVLEHIELGRNLGPADHGRDRRLRIAQRLFQRLKLGLHRAAGKGRENVRQPLGGGMGAVRGGKGIVHVEIAKAGKAFDHGGIVLFLATEEAGVLQHGNVTGLQRRDGGLVAFPVHVLDRAAQHVRERRDDLLQRELCRRLALGAAEVGENQHHGALVGQFGQRRHRRAQAGIVGHRAIGHGHVQVLADQHGLAGNVTDIVQRLEHGHSSVLASSLQHRRGRA
jgi:hypothetical protein